MTRGFRLERSFFEVSTEDLGRNLIGCHLVHRVDGRQLVGRIVETEAYLGQGDPASHSHRGQNERNSSMFGVAGTAYVYLIYGMHLCLNVVSGEVGVGEAVLLRSLEPIRGLEQMRARRGVAAERELCSGPAKLTVAMGIRREQDGSDLCGGELEIWSPESFGGWEREGVEIAAGPRIGISKATDLALRFSVRESPWVSR